MPYIRSLIVVGISGGRVALVVFSVNEELRTFKFAFLKLLIVEVSEVSATLIALSIPGVKPIVDKFILRKDTYSEFGGSRISSNRGSIGSQSSGLSALKGPSHFSVLDDESAAQYGAEVEDGRSKQPEGKQNFI
ncbi:protein related to integral membrane protein pth11 [Hirsutella rhossiliensis]